MRLGPLGRGNTQRYDVVGVVLRSVIFTVWPNDALAQALRLLLGYRFGPLESLDARALACVLSRANYNPPFHAKDNTSSNDCLCI